MTNATSTVRALITYALVLPAALVIGYLLANQRGPLDLTTWGFISLVLLVAGAPLILRWHHQAMFLTWNMTAVAFFLPGQPQFWMLFAFGSFLVAVSQRALSREMQFIHAPSVVAPLLFFVLVIVVTAKFTSGFGLASFGGSSTGAKRYYWMLFAIMGFLAMIARPIPKEKVWTYLGLFFFGNVANIIGGFLPLVPPSLWFIFYLFPVETTGLGAFFDAPIGVAGMFRFYGLSLAAMGVFFYLLARHSIRGLLGSGNVLRLGLFLAMLPLCAIGGFRSFFLLMCLTFMLAFFLEGLLRSRYAVFLGLALLFLGMVAIPTAKHLPLPIQRTLSFLPIPIDPVARYDAQATSEWRIELWKRALPEVPQYFWFGKGYGISARDLDSITDPRRVAAMSNYDTPLITQDYHSGPLSLIIPFGIWGVIAWLWLVAAGTRALYLNRKHGDPQLNSFNTFMLAYFLARTIHFLSIFGGIQGDLAAFVAPLALSLCVNGGIRRPVQNQGAPRTISLRFRERNAPGAVPAGQA